MLAVKDAGSALAGGSRARTALIAAVIVGAAVAILPIERAPGIVVAGLGVLAGAVVTFGHPRGFAVLGGTVYVVSVHWAYLEWVSPAYAYSGLIDVGADASAIVVVTALAVLPLIWLPTALTRPSDIVLWFLYLFGYVPATSIPLHLLGPDPWTTLPFTILVAIAFATLALTRRIPRLSFSSLAVREPMFTRLLVVASIVPIAYLLYFFGIPTSVPDFDQVYDARASYAIVAGGTPGAGYLVPWAGNVIYPLLTAVGLVRRAPVLVILGAAGELLIYATTGFKTVLFSILLVPALWLAITWFRGRLGGLLAWGGVGVIVGSIIGTIVTGSIWPIALFVTRLLAVPGQMTAYYYDFFTTHPTYELSRSFLRPFITAPYEVDPPFLIGAVYLNSPGTDANANLWADAVANYGLVGIIPFTLVLGVYLWLLDSVSLRRDLRIIGPTLGLVGITLGNGAVFTSILTLGLGLLVVLIALMPTDGEEAVPALPALPQPGST